MKIGKSVLSTGLVLSVLGCAVTAVSVAAVPENAAVVHETVFESSLSLNEEDVAAYFDVDRALGRAWIDVVITSGVTLAEPAAPQIVREALEGLYYDPVRKQVIYQNGANQIVCAEDSSVLWAKTLKDTGRCELRSTTEARKVDDGFNVQIRNVGKVVFEARNPA